jgi:S1-C subfamily serine protease
VLRLVFILLIMPLSCMAAAAESNSWIATARILRNGDPSGSGVYLRAGLVLTAAHLIDQSANMAVRIAGATLPAQILKQGKFDEIDLSLLQVDTDKLPSSQLPELQLCKARPWPGDTVIVVDAERASQSRIVAPEILTPSFRNKFATLIADVATTGNSGSGVFAPAEKCLLGIMSRKFTTGGKDVAKYFVPVWEILDFLPEELRSQL